MGETEQQVVVVTGAGRGIGREVARRFARGGATVAVCDVLDMTTTRTTREIVAEGGRAIPIVLDVADGDAVRAAVERVVAELGGVDVLANCAAVYPPPTPLTELAEADWEHVLAVNATGTFLVSKYVGRAMRVRGTGCIVNVSSVSARAGVAGTAAYCASKAAIEMLTRVMAAELGPHGVRVNAVAPGFVDTDVTHDQVDDPAIGASFLPYFPVGRFGSASDVAAVVCFLASEEAAYVNGEVVTVDGGWTTRLPAPAAYGGGKG